MHEYFHHYLHVFTACMFMYSLHVFSRCKYQYLCIVYDNRSTEVPLIVPMQVFMRILLIMCTNHCTLYNVFLLWQTCSTHVHLYFSHCLHVFTAWMFMYSLHVFSAYNHQHNIMCIVYDNRTTVVPWSVSMNCFHASIQAHTHHHVHILLHTILSLFFFKIVVHIRMYTSTIACLYSLHPCSCIHSMFLVHTITNICASYSITDRLKFHELFPWIVSMQLCMRILIIMCTYYCTLYLRCFCFKL